MKKDQQDLLYRRFQTQQYIDHREATEISKEINMPVKMIKAWFSNMRRKVKRNSKNKDYLNDSNQFDIKQPTVSVLMDMNHLNSLKTSLESGEIVINDLSIPWTNHLDKHSTIKHSSRCRWSVIFKI